MGNDQILKWRFDISTFRLIGRDLITDRITALFELIKNCYDANAQNVKVVFENIVEGNSTIIIEDDGYGMSFEDIRDKWMVIGTSSKRSHPYSPEPYNRKCLGEKGIGRFAVDKLGDRVSIITKKAGESRWLQVDIDWTAYYTEIEREGDVRLFTDVENSYSYIDAESTVESGTKLVITSLREPWVKNDVKHLMREISKLVSPFANLVYPLNIRVQALEFGLDDEVVKSLGDFDLATASFNIGVDAGFQQSVYYDKKKQIFDYKRIPLKSFGGIRMAVYYFNESARRLYRTSFPNSEIDGFKVYRDGVIATPFAETNDDPDKKRDVLGVDKRLWRDVFSRVSTREFIGIIEITSEGNPNIIDSTNRQDFVDNEEYRSFKEFVITQLSAIQAYKVEERRLRSKDIRKGLQAASDDIKQLRLVVDNIVLKNPELKSTVKPLLKQVNATGKSVKLAITEHKKALEEFARKENVYMSIMSLQQFSITVTHAVRTMLNQIRDAVEFFYLYYPDPKEEKLFVLYAREMHKQFKILNRVIDYLLSYSQSNIGSEEFELKSVFEEILGHYDSLFKSQGVLLQTCFPENLTLNGNRQFLRDILQNLVDNSLKAMEDAESKIIRCSYEVKDEMLEILVSDTGRGIPIENREQIFELYYTTTEEQGGGGVGLYIVKTRVEALRGSVSVVDSEFGKIGATLKIIIPFKK